MIYNATEIADYQRRIEAYKAEQKAIEERLCQRYLTAIHRHDDH